MAAPVKLRPKTSWARGFAAEQMLERVIDLGIDAEDHGSIFSRRKKGAELFLVTAFYPHEAVQESNLAAYWAGISGQEARASRRSFRCLS